MIRGVGLPWPLRLMSWFLSPHLSPTATSTPNQIEASVVPASPKGLMGPLRWFFFQSFFYTESILDRHRHRVNLIFWHFDKISNRSELCRTDLNLKYTLPNSSTMSLWHLRDFSHPQSSSPKLPMMNLRPWVIIATQIADENLGPSKGNLCRNSNLIRILHIFDTD